MHRHRLSFAPLVPLALAALLALLPVTARAQAAASPARVDSLIHAMTLDEKLGFLHGARDPDPTTGLGSAGYMAGVPRLGIPPLRLTDGPAGIRTASPATALPAPVAIASSFDTSLARRYGQVLGREGLARNQDVLLAPMVNIVRVPQAGRNFETLGEDPLLASQLVAAEIAGIQSTGMMATVKHYAANNFENDRNRVDVHADARTLNEIYFPAFDAAVRAGAASVMCSYNRLNGTYACANRELLTDYLRTRMGFSGWVMTDWFAAHDLGALQAGLDQEMPGTSSRPGALLFADTLRAAVQSGRIPASAVDAAVRRILLEMDRFGLLNGTPRVRPPIDTAADAAVARDAEERGAVLLRNESHTLPLARADLGSVVVIGPTARTPLIGGGGSAHVTPFHTVSTLDALGVRAGRAIRWLPGIDLEGDLMPASAFTGLSHVPGAVLGGPFAPPPTQPAAPAGPPPTPAVDAQVNFTGSSALAAGSAWTWTGSITAPASGEYDVKLQTRGARGALVIADSIRVPSGFFGGGSLIPTADGLSNATAHVQLTAGQAVPIRIMVDGRAGGFGAAGRAGTDPVQVRLAWSTPARRQALIDSAVTAARTAHTVIVVAYDEGTEGQDRATLALPERQDALVDAVTRANPRTVVVLNTGSAVLMPWIDHTAAVLETWYPGQEGGDAVAALLLGEADPAGKLPVTFPRAAGDAPTSVATRYPGVSGTSSYDEGVLVGYRWYDTKNMAPLFPFGHGLSYTSFQYTRLSVTPAADGYDVSFTLRNSGAVAGAEVAQVYASAAAAAPVAMAAQQLAGFQRVQLAPSESRRVTVHVESHQLSYWSDGAWTLPVGAREIRVGSSSRDVRLRAPLPAAR